MVQNFFFVKMSTENLEGLIWSNISICNVQLYWVWGWDRVNFLYSGQPGAVIWISIDNTEKLSLLLSQGLFCFSHHPSSEGTGGPGGTGKSPNQDSWPDLICPKGCPRPCHDTQHIRKEEGWDVWSDGIHFPASLLYVWEPSSPWDGWTMGRNSPFCFAYTPDFCFNY